MKIKILYEDSNILAIDKPSGILVHPADSGASTDGRSKPTRAGGEKTIVDWILKNYPKMKNVGESIFVGDKEIKKSGIVHRLDKETSGVLLLAKNQKAYQFLKNQFSAPALEITKGGLADRQDRVKKIYIAIVSGWVKNDCGVINKPIGRSRKDFRRHLSGRGARGEMREAITQYKVLKRFQVSHNKFTYLEICPKTGRTHQIRVHMKFLNHPIVCDSLYNPGQPCPKGISHLALHAKSIEFSALGGSASGGKNSAGKTLKIESPIPLEFKKMVK
jgi:23S rRNA pseudouridine1911/1915/1917 synthase